MNNVNIIIGANLRAIRQKRGLSQAALAEKAGIRAQQLHKYEAGINNMSISRLLDLAKILRVKPAAIYKLPDQENLPETLLTLKESRLLDAYRKINSVSKNFIYTTALQIAND